VCRLMGRAAGSGQERVGGVGGGWLLSGLSGLPALPGPALARARASTSKNKRLSSNTSSHPAQERAQEHALATPPSLGATAYPPTTYSTAWLQRPPAPRRALLAAPCPWRSLRCCLLLLLMPARVTNAVRRTPSGRLLARPWTPPALAQPSLTSHPRPVAANIMTMRLQPVACLHPACALPAPCPRPAPWDCAWRPATRSGLDTPPARRPPWQVPD
jgi:hypothetical protein